VGASSKDFVAKGHECGEDAGVIVSERISSRVSGDLPPDCTARIDEIVIQLNAAAKECFQQPIDRLVLEDIEDPWMRNPIGCGICKQAEALQKQAEDYYETTISAKCIFDKASAERWSRWAERSWSRATLAKLDELRIRRQQMCAPINEQTPVGGVRG
jgi:hypothetical protein